MIDYNMSPTFILSKEPSHYLSKTPSADLYSTEYDQYGELIRNVYTQINGVLSLVSGYQWTGRNVPMDGVIINTYLKGEEQKQIIINYTEDSVTIGGHTITPLSASVIADGEVQ